MSYELIKTDSSNKDFQKLIAELDEYLTVMDGVQHGFYDQYNKMDFKYALVAYEGENPVGCGAIKEYDKKTAEVKRMYVLPGQRGKGVASLILQGLEEWAAELGYTKCILETGIRQQEAVALYIKRGYASIPNYGPYVGVDNSVCFENHL